MKRIFWPLQAILERFLTGDRNWGSIRLVAVFSMVLFIGIFSGLIVDRTPLSLRFLLPGYRCGIGFNIIQNSRLNGVSDEFRIGNS